MTTPSERSAELDRLLAEIHIAQSLGPSHTLARLLDDYRALRAAL